MAVRQAARGRQGRRRDLRALSTAALFVAPGLIGFLAFYLYPLVYLIYLSFTRYSGIGTPVWVGLANYARLLTDPLLRTALANTVYYTALAVPAGLVVGLALALAMNQRVKEVAVYRTALFFPSVLPVFALSFVFIWLLNPRFGLVNELLLALHLPAVDWLGDPRWFKVSLVLLALLSAGHTAVIMLAGLQSIPPTLYEAAEIDGARAWARLRHVTLPLMAPVLLYNLIIGLHLELQVFTQAYIFSSDDPNNNATLFFVLYIYRNAFSYNQLGYAAALSWVLFSLSFGLAMLVFRGSRRWVGYDLNA